MNGRRPVTIDDVARICGFSVATVSRALRGLPNVAPATRTLIEQTAARLDYRPDPAATRLATGRSRTVAMAVPSLDSWYFGQVMAGAEAILTEAGYDLLVFAVDCDDSRRRVTNGPLVKRADGLIMVDLSLSGQELTTLDADGVGIVSVGAPAEGFMSVQVDDIGVAELATEHLISLGHQRIGLLKGRNDDPMHFDVPRERHGGYRNALFRAALPIDVELERAGDFSVPGGAKAMTELLELTDPPTAVFAMSDEMAFGAMKVLWERGMSVPDDMSIVAVDNHEFAAVVGLTTVDQHVGEHGSAAARLMLQRLSVGTSEPTRYQIPIKLIERRSTAPHQR